MMKSYTDLMIDLETLGTTPGCAILEIGMTFFDRANTERPMESFSIFPSINEQFEAGFFTTDETKHWWLTKNKEAYDWQMLQVRVSVERTVTELHKLYFAYGREGHTMVWAKGSHFDFPILNSLVPHPWHYRDMQDMRTLKLAAKALDPDAGITMDKNLTAHRGIDDSVHQAQQVQSYWETICLS